MQAENKNPAAAAADRNQVIIKTSVIPRIYSGYTIGPPIFKAMVILECRRSTRLNARRTSICRLYTRRRTPFCNRIIINWFGLCRLIGTFLNRIFRCNGLFLTRILRFGTKIASHHGKRCRQQRQRQRFFENATTFHIHCNTSGFILFEYTQKELACVQKNYAYQKKSPMGDFL